MGRTGLAKGQVKPVKPVRGGWQSRSTGNGAGGVGRTAGDGVSALATWTVVP